MVVAGLVVVGCGGQGGDAIYERVDGCYPSYVGVLPDMASAQCEYDAECNPDASTSYEKCVSYWIETTPSVPDCYDGCGAADCVDAYRAAGSTCAVTGQGVGDADIQAILEPCLQDRPWTGPGCAE